MGVPSPKDKRAACGKATLIILYTNGKFSLMGFFCHRWDCKRCASQRREDIRTTITALHATWYVKSITPAEYVAARKRIVRAGAKYCALGTGDSWLFLTTEPVLKGSQEMGGEALDLLIEESLKGQHTPRKRRFRHSNGLFPETGRASGGHIERKIVVAGQKERVLAELKKQGYGFSDGGDGAEYVMGRVESEEFREFLYNAREFRVEWVE